MRTPQLKAARPGDEAQPVTAESLGWQLRAALPPLRLHSISLCGTDGDVLWLSEGALGPDEHGLIVEAANRLSTEASASHCEIEMEDGRYGVFLPVRAPQGELVALAMILTDSKAIGSGLGARILSAQVRGILQRVAVFLRPQIAMANVPTLNAPPPAPPPVKASKAPPVPERSLSATTPLKALPVPAPAALSMEDRIAKAFPLDLDATSETIFEMPAEVGGTTTPSVLSSAAVDEILSFELMDDAPAPAPSPSPPPTPKAFVPSAEPPKKTAAIAPTPTGQTSMARFATGATSTRNTLPTSAPPTDPALKDLVLSVQQLTKLRPGGRTKRFEVLVRTRQDPGAVEAAADILKLFGEKSDVDGFVISRLFTWLREHPEERERDSLTFSINLSNRALHDDGFADKIALGLRRSGAPAGSIGFELAESSCVQHRPQAERFVAACEKLGCFLVLDDFTLDTRALSFLGSKSLKLLKVDARLTNGAMKDKLSQALVIAISQAAKVLGVHCAAKKLESQMVRRWVTAIGFDFAQGMLLDGPQSIDTLAQKKGPDA